MTSNPTSMDIRSGFLPGAESRKVRVDRTTRGDLPDEPVVVDMRPDRTGLRDVNARTRRDRVRLRSASWAFTTRRVPQGVGCSILPDAGAPEAGDLVLARVDALGHHGALQLVSGRRRTLFPGDEIVVAYGNRYACAQFESVVPESMGPCHLVAGGGIASRAVNWHAKISRGPTQITPIGAVADASGRRLNLRDFALEPRSRRGSYRPTAIAVIGTSMDSGKTQTCAYLVRGLIAGGSRVGYAKITGTGAGGDYWLLRDAGAETVLDFTDVGHASTYLLGSEEIERTLRRLVDLVAEDGVDAMVLEIADGVLQPETAALLQSETFRDLVGGMVVAAQDSMGASAAVSWLRDHPTPRLALSGVLTAAPLQVREAADATGLPLFDREALASRQVAMDLLGRARRRAHHTKFERSTPDADG